MKSRDAGEVRIDLSDPELRLKMDYIQLQDKTNFTWEQVKEMPVKDRKVWLHLVKRLMDASVDDSDETGRSWKNLISKKEQGKI